VTSDDDTKKLILARRARFIAAALAGAGLSSGSITACGDSEGDKTVVPQPCLSIAGPRDASADPDAASPDAVTTTDDAATPSDGNPDSDDALPQPCLVPPP